MSRYIPRRAVEAEQFMQVVRRQNGLKDGSYVRYPDAEKGPYIIKANKLEQSQHAEVLALMKEYGLKQLAALESAQKTTQDKEL